MDYFNDEIPKYKKKSNKKTVSKSKHKHTYKGCLLKEDRTNSYLLSEYCTICGKLGDTQFIVTERIEGTKYYRVLSDKELLEKYSDYEVKEIDDIFKTKKIDI